MSALEGYDIEWPLWGLQLESDHPLERPLLIEDFHFYQPTWVQWAEMEKSDVVYEHAGQYLREEQLGIAADGPKPPVCVLGLSPVNAEGWPDHDQQLYRCRSLVAALRLYTSGVFVDPAETCTYAALPGGIQSRVVGVLRSALYGRSFEDPYVVRDDDADALTIISQAIGYVRSLNEHVNFALALENYVLSFRFGMERNEIALYRLMAVEALLKRVNIASARRLKARVARVADVDPAVATRVVRDLPALRNDIAHRFSETNPGQEEIDFLRDGVRSLLGEYLELFPELDPAGPILDFRRRLTARASE